MHDIAAVNTEECIAGNFFPGDKNVIAAGDLCLKSGTPKAKCKPPDIILKQERHILAGHDAGHHEIAPVRIHAAAPALSAEDTDTIGPAIREIDLRRHHLIPSDDNRRRHLPHEEGFIFGISCKIFLHCKIKDKAPFFAVIKNNVYHLCLLPDIAEGL